MQYDMLNNFFLFHSDLQGFFEILILLYLHRSIVSFHEQNNDHTRVSRFTCFLSSSYKTPRHFYDS